MRYSCGDLRLNSEEDHIYTHNKRRTGLPCLDDSGSLYENLDLSPQIFPTVRTYSS